jgi:hypothetical protein
VAVNGFPRFFLLFATSHLGGRGNDKVVKAHGHEHNAITKICLNTESSESGSFFSPRSLCVTREGLSGAVGNIGDLHRLLARLHHFIAAKRTMIVNASFPSRKIEKRLP